MTTSQSNQPCTRFKNGWTKPILRSSNAPKGDTPVEYVVGGTRQKLLMISTVTNQGKTSWMMKHVIEACVPCRTKDKLRKATEHMTAIEKNPDRLKSFFKDPIIAYAA
jgi:hypothetical protein